MKAVSAIVGVGLGVGAVIVLFWALNWLVDRLPERWEGRLRPAVFVGPALAVVGAFLVVPAFDTVRRSFMDASGTNFVGLANYRWLVTDEGVRETLWNTLLWIAVVPAATVFVGLAAAVLADRLRPGAERLAKSVIFVPMAISFVGAGTIWKFVYAWRPEGRPQVGLLNGVWVGLGGSPVAWIRERAINDFALMVILVWLMAGFAMVLLSAAIKGLPPETLEAARMDGAGELQVFWRIVLPQIWPTVVVVGTTVLIWVLKIFDIVFVMTGGRDGTDVLAHRFVVEFITFGQSGRAAVMVVFLIVVTIPFMVLNARRFREQEVRR